MTWTRRLYPVLFAIFPVLGVAAKNPGYDRLSDALVVSFVLAVGVGVVYAVAYVVLRFTVRRAWVADGAAIVALVAVGVFFLYGPLLSWMEFVSGNPRMGPGITLVVLGAIVVAAWFGSRRGLEMRTVSRYLTLVGVLLVGGSVVHLAYSRVLRARAIARSTLVQNLERPVPLRATSAAADPAPGRGAAAGAVSHVSLAGHPVTAPKRDVFIILLDEYPSAQVLSEQFGIDNRPFEDSLRTLGFRIPAELRSNYANTLMSISSFLNFAHTSALAQVMSPSSHDFGPAAYLIRHNRIGRFLKARGYRYVFFPSSWYGPTVDNPEADMVFRLDSSFDVGNAMQRSELASYFTWSTLFRTVRDRFPTEEEVHTADAAHTFAGIAALPRGPRPTFVLAHVLMPHIPYIEDSSCHALPRNGKIYKDASPGGRAALTAELYCLNHQILTTAHTILDHSTTPPIIILEGDHGTQSLHIFGSMTALPTTAQSRERFRPFGAYYLPDGGGATIPDSVSLVNILRYVLNDYFGANLPLLPNTMYYSHWERPYRLTEVDANFHVVRPGAPAASAPMGDTARAAQ